MLLELEKQALPEDLLASTALLKSMVNQYGQCATGQRPGLQKAIARCIFKVCQSYPLANQHTKMWRPHQFGNQRPFKMCLPLEQYCSMPQVEVY